MAIGTTTARADIFKNVISVLDINSTHPVTSTWSEDVATLPEIVVGIPESGHKVLAFANGISDKGGTFDVEVFANTVQELVTVVDEVENIMFTHRATLEIQNLQLGEGSVNPIAMGDKLVYSMILPFSFTLKRL